jgi:DNA-directed RNA polymerase specialized sigma24 family protein
MTGTIRKPDNPAKAFLRQYRARKIRMESLSREIEKARERALSVTVRPKEVNVQGSHAAFDSMAEAVCKAADASETLYAEYQECNRVLVQIMAAISAVPDEMQKTVLTLRYVEGRSWEDIQDMIGYERTQTLVIHGRALWTVKQWLERGESRNEP